MGRALLVVVVFVGAVAVTLVLLWAPMRASKRRPASYAVTREPFPTIEATTVAPGNVVGVQVDRSKDAYPVRARRVERQGDYVVIEHFDPRGCAIGVHGDECVVRTPVRAGERLRFFPAEPGA